MGDTQPAGGPVSVIPRAPIWLSTGLSWTTLADIDGIGRKYSIGHCLESRYIPYLAPLKPRQHGALQILYCIVLYIAPTI